MARSRLRLFMVAVSVAVAFCLVPARVRADELAPEMVESHEAGSDALPVVTEPQASASSLSVTPTRPDEAFGVGENPGPSEDRSFGTVEPQLGVAVHLAQKGWQGSVGSGALAGTTGEARAIEAIVLTLGDDQDDGEGDLRVEADPSDIWCRVHVSGVGWRDWVGSGTLAGTTGESRAIEAVRIRLSGDLERDYDVYYQVHVANIGWMGLASNGSTAGTTTRGLRVEALRVWLLPKGEQPDDPSVGVAEASRLADGLVLDGHVQNVGWQPWVAVGGTVGTTGQGRRLEALRISDDNLEDEGSIEYEAHVQNVGWQGVRGAGQTAGTTGEGKRVEALRMRLTGDMEARYTLWYRVHVSNVGWLDWTCSWDVFAGSEGMSLPIEAVQVALVERSEGVPTESGKPSSADVAFPSPYLAASQLSYEAHVQNEGWKPAVSDGAEAGTTGRALRLEALKVSVSSDGDCGLPGGISYRAHVQNYGWRAWQTDGGVAGSVGEGKRVEAIELKLTGRLANVYDVWYRSHIEGFGWLGWTRNGSTSGSTGISRRVEAVQIRLVGKAGGAPGSTWRPYVDKTALYDEMERKAQGYGSPTGQLILVNLSTHRVGVFTGRQGNWTRIHNFPCSVGAPYTPTVRGVFSIGSRGYAFGSGYTCYYWTQFYGNYLFHSIKYDQGTFRVQDGRLGMNISHGCVRMAIGDARWINENIRSGTTVVVY